MTCVKGTLREYGKKVIHRRLPMFLFHIEKGKVLGIVGESGSGKSTIAQCITRLVEPSSGEIIFRGEEITRMKAGKLNKYRRNMQMIFQDPDSATGS